MWSILKKISMGKASRRCEHISHNIYSEGKDYGTPNVWKSFWKNIYILSFNWTIKSKVRMFESVFIEYYVFSFIYCELSQLCQIYGWPICNLADRDVQNLTSREMPNRNNTLTEPKSTIYILKFSKKTQYLTNTLNINLLIDR